jgi:hypothetical protein
MPVEKANIMEINSGRNMEVEIIRFYLGAVKLAICSRLVKTNTQTPQNVFRRNTK